MTCIAIVQIILSVAVIFTAIAVLVGNRNTKRMIDKWENEDK